MSTPWRAPALRGAAQSPRRRGRCCHGRRPVKSTWAGPVMITWPSLSRHSMRRARRRPAPASPCGRSGPGATAATRAAQAPVPQALVRPRRAPRPAGGCGRGRRSGRNRRSRASGNSGWCSIIGPDLGDRRGLDVGHEEHHVRIAHRDAAGRVQRSAWSIGPTCSSMPAVSMLLRQRDLAPVEAAARPCRR